MLTVMRMSVTTDSTRQSPVSVKYRINTRHFSPSHGMIIDLSRDSCLRSPTMPVPMDDPIPVTKTGGGCLSAGTLASSAMTYVRQIQRGCI